VRHALSYAERVSTQPLAAPRTLKLVGTEVARIGLGTNRLTSTPENQAFLREAIEAGLRHIDTAHVYSMATASGRLGRLSLRIRRGW